MNAHFFFILTFAVSLLPGYSVSTNDKAALQALYDATKGPTWLWRQPAAIFGNKWRFTGTPPSDPCINNWQGVNCSGSDSSSVIIGITLNAMNMSGAVPNALGSLTSLEMLDFSQNFRLVGPLPSTLGQLTQLRSLIIDTSRLASSIPIDLCSATGLQVLDLSSSRITGEMPACLLAMPQLETLRLQKNNISGQFPSPTVVSSSLQVLDMSQNFLSGFLPDLTLLSSLQYVDLGYNFIWGPLLFNFSSTVHTFDVEYNLLSGIIVTDNFKRLTNLSKLVLNTNRLSSSVPMEISLLSSLTHLDISLNNFNGEISSGLGNLLMLQELHMGYNPFMTTIPSSICNATSLVELDIPQARLYGTVPECLWHHETLKEVNLRRNALIGALWPNDAYMPSVSRIVLEHNRFSGNIPPISNMPSLAQIDVSRNSLTGQLTFRGYCNLLNGSGSSLRLLEASHNYFGGVFPVDGMECMNQLAVLRIGNNSIAGPIPTSLGTLTSLTALYIHYNKFSSTLPAEIGALTNLTFINTFHNLLSQPIPHSICNLTSLMTLNLAFNFFSGTIPDCISHMRSLRIVTLSVNLLEGPIPENIGSCGYITNMYINHTDISGTLPSSLGRLSLIKELDLTTNYLSGTLPNELSSLLLLGYWNMSENYFGGRLPPYIQCMSLSELSLSYNLFTGALPGDCNGTQLPFNARAGLIFFDISHNSLSGSLPQNMLSKGTASADLRVLILAANDFSGPLPPTLPSAAGLETLLLQGNRFTGNLESILSSYVGKEPLALSAIDLSSNAFSGPVPQSLFRIAPHLKTVALTDNCFSGEVPSSVCEVPSLEILILNGLSSSQMCKQDKWLGVSTHRWKTEGTLPNCIFQLPNLKSLHVAGNAYWGEIVVPVNVTTSLLETLQLSNNRFSGSLPDKLQHLTSLVRIDLSYNRFDGILHTHFVPDVDFPTHKTSLKLYSNRLSGLIPQRANQYDEIDMLDGNLFDCNRFHPRPHNDPKRHTYACGSQQFDDSMILACVVLLIIAALACGVRLLFISHFSATTKYLEACVSFAVNVGYWKTLEHVLTDGHEYAFRPVIAPTLRPSYMPNSTQNSADSSRLTHSPHHVITSQIRQLLRVLQRLSSTTCFLCGIIICVAMPLYSILKSVSYDTHAQQYRWFPSVAYLAGIVPAVLLSIIIIVMLCTYAIQSYANHNFLSAVDMPTKNYIHREQNNISVRGGLLMISVIVADMLVVLSVNGIYISIVLTTASGREQVLMQLFMAVFKIAWNASAVSFLVQLMGKLSPGTSGSKAWMRLLLLTLNTVAAPWLAAFLSDRSCFRDALLGTEEVTATYSINYCLRYLEQTLSCLNYHTSYYDVTIAPPFVYNFQCASSVLKIFAPVLMYSHILMLLIPALYTVLSQYNPSKLPDAVVRLCPWVLWPYEDSVNRLYLLRPDFIVSSISVDILVLLTFGLACPILGFVVCCSVVIKCEFWKLVITRYIDASNQLFWTGTKAQRAFCAENIAQLDYVCSNAWRGPKTCVFGVVAAAIVFYGCILFDIAGDEVGVVNAFWFPIGLVILACFVYLASIRRVQEIAHYIVVPPALSILQWFQSCIYYQRRHTEQPGDTRKRPSKIELADASILDDLTVDISNPVRLNNHA